MITAIDSNVLFDILAPDPTYFERSARALGEAANAGSLVICDLVYAELCVHFQRQSDCDKFLLENDIRVEADARGKLPSEPSVEGLSPGRGRKDSDTQ